MSDLGTYTFLPWLRQGIATEITRVAGTGGPMARAQVDVAVDISAAGATRTTEVTLDLHGPGEIIGFDPRMIVRLDPRAGVQDTEPNYFPAVEFHEPDFLWRYTPARATTENRLHPWLVLVVLSVAEIRVQRPATADGHLAELEVDSASLLPNLSQSWAWAHAQITALADGESVQGVLDREPHRTVSRLICPISLKPNTPYKAFLVPAFERGRLAGLKLPIDTAAAIVDALTPAWTGTQGTVTLPVYFTWEFSTGAQGDFEYLVRKLEPRVIRDVGQRKIDVSAPDPALPPAASRPLDMEGALKALSLVPAPWADAERIQFLDGDGVRAGLKSLVNRPQDLLESGAGTPIVAPPLYGRWHAKQNRLRPGQPPAWFNTLNQDPRHRSSASLGTTIVQQQQEQLMASAWEQLDEVLETNEKLRQTQLSRELADQVKTKYLGVLDDEEAIAVTAPVHRRLRASPVTFHALARHARVDYFSVGAFRRVTRPRGTVSRRLRRFANGTPSKLFARANAGTIMPAPAPITPDDLQTRRKVIETLVPSSATAQQLRLQDIASWLLFAVAVLLVIAVLLVGAPVALVLLAVVVAAALVAAAMVLRRRRGRLRAAAGFRDGTLTATGVLGAGPASDFVPVASVGAANVPAAPAAGTRDPQGVTAFKRAMADLADQVFAPPPLEAAPVPLRIPAVRRRLMEGLNPRVNHVVAMRERLQIASWVDWKPRDPLDHVMASPEFDQPMYEPLRDLSQEFLLPGIGTIPENTTGLLLTNQSFIEAYMAGLNHEMARELLWREYPTDQRSTCFRQFWDVRGYVDTGDPPRDPASFLDIKRMHEWQERALGQNTARTPPPGGAHLVLIVRGEVLKRYPTTRVYAVRAAREADGTLTLGTVESHPVFSGTLEPDVSFFGFELTKEQVRGRPDSTTDLGWFFVLQQQPTEPRFGLDIADPATAGGAVGASWDDLSWGHLVDTIDDLRSFRHIDLADGRPDVQFTDASAAAWHAGAGSDAAQLAYITMQKPFRVAMHGAFMVPEEA